MRYCNKKRLPKQGGMEPDRPPPSSFKLSNHNPVNDGTLHNDDGIGDHLIKNNIRKEREGSALH